MTDEFEALAAQNRKRILTVVAALVAVVALVWFFNRAPDLGPVIDCGDLDTRPGGDPLPHDRYCTLKATVETELVLTMGKVNEGAADEANRKAGLRYFVKLPGPVVAALPGGRPDIENHKRPADHLMGFRVDGVGRIFDPAQEKGYAGTGVALRKKFGIAEDAPMRVFDAADAPPTD